ncbi:MAG: cyanophycinase [Planctomycetota bacterium]
MNATRRRWLAAVLGVACWGIAGEARAQAPGGGGSERPGAPPAPGPTVTAPASADDAGWPAGTLVIAGGGSLGDEIRQRALSEAGGPQARVVVIPQASALADAGERARSAWLEAGAADVAILALEPAEAAEAAAQELTRATLIWITGGDQNRLMEAIGKTDVPRLIRERYRAGAVIAGTSAGAAVMAEHMFTGQADLKSVSAAATETRPGLGLVDVLVDQHFHARGRFNRLLSAVLDRPDRLGIGIDEGTAIVVQGGGIEVIGRSSAMVIDARSARCSATPPGSPAAAEAVQLHLLRAGMRFELEARSAAASRPKSPAEPAESGNEAHPPRAKD